MNNFIIEKYLLKQKLIESKIMIVQNKSIDFFNMKDERNNREDVDPFKDGLGKPVVRREPKGVRKDCQPMDTNDHRRQQTDPEVTQESATGKARARSVSYSTFRAYLG